MNKCIDMKLSACQTPHVIKISGMHKSNHETYQQGGLIICKQWCDIQDNIFFPPCFLKSWQDLPEVMVLNWVPSKSDV